MRAAARRIDELVPPPGSELDFQARDFAPQRFELGVRGLDLEQNFRARPAAAVPGLLTRHLRMRVTLSHSRRVPALDEPLLLLAPGFSLIHVSPSIGAEQRYSLIMKSTRIGKSDPDR